MIRATGKKYICLGKMQKRTYYPSMEMCVNLPFYLHVGCRSLSRSIKWLMVKENVLSIEFNDDGHSYKRRSIYNQESMQEGRSIFVGDSFRPQAKFASFQRGVNGSNQDSFDWLIHSPIKV